MLMRYIVTSRVGEGESLQGVDRGLVHLVNINTTCCKLTQFSGGQPEGLLDSLCSKQLY